MPQRLLILELLPCGCDAEGKVHAALEDGTPIWFYYMGPDLLAEQTFIPGSVVEVELVGWNAAATVCTAQEKSITFPAANYQFVAHGQIIASKEDDGEVDYLLDAGLSFYFDNEDGEEPIKVGDWIRLEGELRADW